MIRIGALAVVLAATTALSACAGRNDRPQLAYEERPVELLYNTGYQRLERERWADAVDYFQEVERQHPYSEWSRRAILMQIYAYYQQQQLQRGHRRRGPLHPALSRATRRPPTPST